MIEKVMVFMGVQVRRYLASWDRDGRGNFDHIMAAKAEALITVRSSCYIILDLNQPRIKRLFNMRVEIPALQYTQPPALDGLRIKHVSHLKGL